tara:strand:- start:53743 stop:54537 length:795 start_codon:yes stop_codon:yes gene_type:complete
MFYYGTAVVALTALLSASTALIGDSEVTKAALSERLPKTQIDQLDCSKIEGLCEVVAGKNLFYVDQTGRYLVVGRVYDMETRQDITAAKLLEFNPDMLARGAARREQVSNQEQPKTNKKKVSAAQLRALPDNGAVRYGKRGQEVTVFSDFSCSYCRRLHDTLKDMNVRVIERPISVLGSRKMSENVVCAVDPELALKAAYNGLALPEIDNCDASGLDANEKFASAHGFNGTPVIVRADGAVLEGYRPKARLQAWLKERARVASK